MKIIRLDSKLGKELNFTSDKFMFFSYMFKDGNVIWISAIEAIEKGKGHFTKLLNAIWEKGWTVKIPVPFPNMEQILIKKGFQKTVDEDCEVWIKQ